MTTSGLQVFNGVGKLILTFGDGIYKKIGNFKVKSREDGSMVDKSMIGKKIIVFPVSFKTLTTGKAVFGASTLPYKVEFNKETGAISWKFDGVETDNENIADANKYGANISAMVLEIDYEYGEIT